jgi:hypothetical protein
MLDLRGRVERKELPNIVQWLLEIESLSLGSNDLNDEDMEFVVDIINANTVKELDLSWNKIGPKGAFVLAEALERNTSLKQLMLVNNPITTEGATFIANGMKKNISLRFLALQSTEHPIDAKIIALVRVLASNSRSQHCNTMILMIHAKTLPVDLLRMLLRFVI